MRNAWLCLLALMLGLWAVMLIVPGSRAVGQPPPAPDAAEPAAESEPGNPPEPDQPAEPAEPAEDGEQGAADDADAESSSPPRRLLDREPFDEIELKDGSIVQVQTIPTDSPGPIEPPMRKSEKLVVSPLSDEGTRYEVAWTEIVAIRRFPELLLAEAKRLTADGQTDQAYDYYDMLQQVYPAWPNLSRELDRFLMADARASHVKGDNAYALAVLDELRARNPKFPRLGDAMGEVLGPLVRAEIEKQDYRAARRLLVNMSQSFPNHKVVTELQKLLSDLAGALTEKAQAARDEGRLSEANVEVARAARIWPAHEGARQLMIELQREYPRVVIGVALPAGTLPGDRLDDWASRRGRRLLQRTLFEFTGYGPQGGEYNCPFGTVSRLELDTRLQFQLKRDVRWSNGQPLTGHDLSYSLLSLADPAQAEFRSDWGDLLKAITVSDVFTVEVDMQRAHVRPESLLRGELRPWDRTAAESGAPPSLGPYLPAETSADSVRYLAREEYFARGEGQPREIIEQHFADPREALTALRRGQVALLDRVNPWEVRQLREDSDIAVEPYAVPTLHCLLPNMQRPFAAHRGFRRGLVYGINRELILNQQLFQGDPVPGCQLLSGPFAAGQNEDDTRGYAYNTELAPRPYQPRLAMSLFALALRDVAAQAKQRGADEVTAVGPIVLAHPPHELARVACRAIQRHLKAIQLTVTLVELPPTSDQTPPEYDFRYAELALWEPVTDARRLLGPEGLVGGCSSYMDLALRQLDEASGWRTARERLLEVHRVAHEDTAVIPLWQITDHLAYNRKVEGIGKRPVTLYQNIEKWRIEPWFLADSE